jgi:hypothetical protein
MGRTESFELKPAWSRRVRLFVADIQTGWGPFVAAYLTSVDWLQFDIGLILTIGTMAAA